MPDIQILFGDRSNQSLTYHRLKVSNAHAAEAIFQVPFVNVFLVVGFSYRLIAWADSIVGLPSVAVGLPYELVGLPDVGR
jgi:hypothetical protein